MCNATATTTDKLHPFEAAGLGKAPFQFVGFERRVGPIMMADGMTQIGAPGQPMGTCNYCLNGIANCYHIKSSEGNMFVVGCDCVEKLYNPTNKPASKLAYDKVYQSIKAEARRQANAARQQREAKRIAEGQEWVTSRRAQFEAMPNPQRAGESMWDKYVWFMTNAGNKGKLDIIKQLMKVVFS